MFFSSPERLKEEEEDCNSSHGNVTAADSSAPNIRCLSLLVRLRRRAEE